MATARDSTRAQFRPVLEAASSLLLPVSCVGCGLRDSVLCADCIREVQARPGTVAVPGLRGVWCGLEYRGVVARVLSAFKDQQRVDLAMVLARALKLTARAALSAQRPGSLALACIPNSRSALRARGYRPVELLLAKAGLPKATRLVGWRQVADQRTLSATQRERNRSGSLRAPASLSGRRVLLVDDVLTTGATLRAATAAIKEVGGEVAGAVILAHTPKRRTHPSILQ